MNATAQRINPADIQMPGYMAGAVADADTETLEQCRADDYAAIRSVLEQYGQKPTDDGMAPGAWKESAPRAATNNLDAVERFERRILAITAELERREKEAEKARKEHKKKTRKRLETVLEQAPEQARELEQRAERVVTASERIRQLIFDMELMAAGSRLSAQFRQISEGSRVAAQALGKKAPELPTLPDGLPDRDEVRHAMQVLSGRVDGFSRMDFRPGDAGKAEDLASQLQD